MPTPTPEEIVVIYTSALDSVSAINTILGKISKTTEEITRLTVNSDHLSGLLAQQYWTTEDLTPFRSAVSSATAWLALGMTGVVATTPPVATVLQVVKEIAPVFDPVKKTWQQTWAVENLVLTAAELAALLAKVKAEKCAALAAYRYGREVGGLTLPSGIKIATDDRSKTLIAGAQIDATANPAILTDFKTATGWVQINAATVGTISAAVASHVRACYSTERLHSDAINALLTVADVEAYDFTTGWPV